MKRIYTALLMLATLTGTAQTYTGDKVIARKQLTVGAKSITEIQTDTTLSLHTKVPSSLAVYNFVLGRLAGLSSGGGAVSSVFGRTGSVTAQSGDYSSFYAALSHTHNFVSLTSKPTTLSGYGITDAATLARLGDTAAALRALIAAGSGGSSQWITSGSNIYYAAGNVSVGSSANYGYTLQVNGNAYLSTDLNAQGSGYFGNGLTVAGAHLTTGNYSSLGSFAVGFNAGGGSPINASAVVEVRNTSKGSISAPVMTTTQRNAISTPAEGLQIFNSTGHRPNWYNGSNWEAPAGILDNIFNYSIDPISAKPAGGNTNFFGAGAGESATGASGSNFFGQSAGQFSTSAYGSNFFGYQAGYNSPSANSSNFFGYQAGYAVTNANSSNFFGDQAGYNATNARYSNFFGITAGYSAVNALGSNFFGHDAGRSAWAAAYSNIFGEYAGQSATSATYSNFFGRTCGTDATNAWHSNFFGSECGRDATNADHSNFFGENAGHGATGAAYSTFMGYNVGNNTQHTITGSNNWLFGTNITTPSASTSNSLNIGGVLFGANLYGTTTGAPSKVGQSNGQIGINTPTPVASAALEIKSNTAGFLKPRMTTTERTAISSPAEGLEVYDLTLHKDFTWDGSTWQAHW